MWSWCWLFFLMRRCCSPCIFTSWPDCQQTVLPARGSEKTNARFMEGKKQMIHHENTPTHTLLICDFLPRYKTTPIPQTPYLPDLVPTDYILFLKLQFTLKVNVLSLLRTFKKIRQWICMLFHKKHSSNASKTVKNAVSGVLGVEWASSKGTRLSTS